MTTYVGGNVTKRVVLADFACHSSLVAIGGHSVSATFLTAFFRKFNDILELSNSVTTNYMDSLMHRSMFSMINTVFEDGKILYRVLEFLN